MNGPFGEGNQFALLFSPRRISLDTQRQSAVAVEFELRQHGRVDQIAVDSVLHEELAREIVHRERPERIDWRKLAFGKSQGVLPFVAVQRLAVRVLVQDRIQGLVA